MKKITYIYVMCLTALAVCFASCDDDDKHDSTPIEVTQIYLEDRESSVPDRPVEYARLNQMIRIEGSGFLGMKKIYVNGYDTYFNLAYVTDNSMLLTLSDKTPVVDADEKVRDKIRFVKSDTEYTHDFVIRASSPSVTSISNTLPQPNEKVIVYGTNLHETEVVTLPGGATGTNITSDPEGKWYSFTMPASGVGSGSIYSEGAHGTAASPAYFNNTDCMVLNFDGFGVQGSWSWTETGSMINADDLVEDPLNSGRGKCVQLIPERLMEAGIAIGKPRATEVWTAGAGEETDNWTRMYSYIPATTPVSEVAFQFDIYVPEMWNTSGVIELVLYNSYNFNGIGGTDDGGYTAFAVPYIQNGVKTGFKTDGWQTITIPFSQFGYFTKADATNPTFGHIVDKRLEVTYPNFGMGFVNTDFTYNGVEVVSVTTAPKIYIDNWRIVPCAPITISDYPEDEE